MPQCCSAGSREAMIHTELTPGTYSPGGCAMSSWPTARELHPANAYCWWSSSPRHIPLGYHRAWLCSGSWNKGCSFLSHPQNCSWAGEVWREARKDSWDRQGKTFTDVSRREDGACMELWMVFWWQKAKVICQLQVLPTQVPMVFHNLDAREEGWGPQPFRKHVTPSMYTFLCLRKPLETSSTQALLHLHWEPLCLVCKTVWSQGFKLYQVTHRSPGTKSCHSKVSPHTWGLTISHITIPSSAIGIYLIEQQQPGQLQL